MWALFHTVLTIIKSKLFREKLSKLKLFASYFRLFASYFRPSLQPSRYDNLKKLVCYDDLLWIKFYRFYVVGYSNHDDRNNFLGCDDFQQSEQDKDDKIPEKIGDQKATNLHQRKQLGFEQTKETDTHKQEYVS